MAGGSYMLMVSLDSGRRIVVGRLGEVYFAPGHYLYCGSAMNGLDQRIARHARANKRIHWHIDYLLAVADLTAAWAIAGPERLECASREALSSLGGECVPRFGSSDCRCPSHLLFFSRRPELDDFNRVLRQLSPPAPEACYWVVNRSAQAR